MRLYWKECPWFKEWGGKVVKVFSGSRLVVGQVGGELKAKDERMQGYLNQVRFLQSKFESFSPRSGNTHADSLATLASSSTQNLPRVILVEDLYKPTEVKGVAAHIQKIEAGSSWMDPIISFLKEDTLPSDKFEAEKIRRKAPRFWIRNCTSAPYLGHTYYAFILKPQSYFLKNYTREFAEVTQEKDLYLIKQSHNDIGGQTCKKKYKSM